AGSSGSGSGRSSRSPTRPSTGRRSRKRWKRLADRALGAPGGVPPARVRHPALEADLEQRLDVERRPVEVDREPTLVVGEDGVLGPGGDPDALRPPVAEGQSDRARVEEQAAIEAAQHL